MGRERMVGTIESQAVSFKSKIKCVGKKEIVGRQNVEFRCLNITEPEGDSDNRETYISSILATFSESMNQSIKHNLGYAISYDIDFTELDQVSNFQINNVGDPFIEMNFPSHSRQFEVAVLDWFAHLWEIEKDDYWGYVTNSVTEGNSHGILLGRELFPDGIFYTSKESHYTIFKIARMYRMECVKIDTLVSGEIDCSHLKTMLLQNKDKPAIINANIGTTIKGAIDDLDLVAETLHECGFQEDRFYIHCDSALFGVMQPLLTGAPKVTFKKPIGSISVSGQKLIGCPMPCGIQMTRIKHINALTSDVEYLATRDCTMTCSRTGHGPIYLWYALTQKGYGGLKQDYEKCVSNAKYLKDLLIGAGVSVMLNEMSNILIFERPRDEDFVQRWHLPSLGNIARVVVMPSDTVEKIDTFYQELVEKRSSWLEGGAGDHQPPCVAPEIGEDNCLCGKHKYLENNGT